MKQVAQNYRTGELAVLDVPVPACQPGGVLVQTLYSLVSTGTEMMKVTEARLSLLGKARARPEQLRTVMDSVTQQGVSAAYKKVTSRLDTSTPLGYSLCGVVVEVGLGAEEFQVGQLVAAAGNESALHADLNWIPVNLCVAVPETVRPEHAAFATVGAIAMQGVRQAAPTLGEVSCVIGLGLVGQLAVRLLLAAGVKVVGLDPVAERCRLAEEAGALLCVAPDKQGVDLLRQTLSTRVGVNGVDHVLLASGGSSNRPAEIAADLARDRARIVDIGKCSLNLPWNAYYEKELDVRFSRSYGPGRYDRSYEYDGVDYPVGYVRWTERRNLGCFIDLLADKAIDVTGLVSGVHPIADAVEVYDRLAEGGLGGVGYLFEYTRPEPPQTPGVGRRHIVTVERAASISPVKKSARRVRVGVIGAGNYASSMILPTMSSLEDVELATVVTQRSLSAYDAQRRFGFTTASTAIEDILDDSSIDVVLISTRHHSHADLTCRALTAGKSVLVDKPLAVDADQLGRIIDTMTDTGNDRLMVGFNRRYSPLLAELRAGYGSPEGPMSLTYRVNAGPLAADSWYLDESREGSRFTGEGGHFIDTVSWWSGALPASVHAVTGPRSGSVHATVCLDDGSVASIVYDTDGNPRAPKETLDVTSGGTSARLDNFSAAAVWTGRKRRTMKSRRLDKGQAGLLAATLQAVRSGGPMPISAESLVRTTAATLAVARSLGSGRLERV